MSQHYQQPQPHQPLTIEQMGIIVRPATPFEMMFLASRKAHYLSMKEKPRNEKHLKFINRELKLIERQQRTQHGYSKIIEL